jgi:hypothetical protein
MEIAKKHQDSLSRIKQNVEKSYEWFEDNYIRFNFFRKFVFDTSMSDDDVAILKSLKKPQIEFNIMEAYISRLLGEFSKQEPSISVLAEDGQQVDPEVIKYVEDHTRYILCDANKSSCEYEVYKDQLSGGFSVFKVTTDYLNEMSFDQTIKLSRAYDPTLCGFDPIARNPTKDDGRFCFELYPMAKEDFIEEYPDVNIEKFKFTKSVEGFNWSYKNNKDDILLLCDYYEKKKKRVKIVKLASGVVMPLKKYEELIELWNNEGNIAQPPAIIGKPRFTDVTTICRYIFVEGTVISYEETDYRYLPLVYVPGNDMLIRDGIGGSVSQMTRPYIYHAKGAQKLKNFAGQTLANEIENMIQHKWIAPKSAIPQEEDYLSAWKDPQQASVLIYNDTDENDGRQIPPPREVQRVATPPEVSGAFNMVDHMMQSILGSYDAALGVNDNQLSGVAIVEAATQSNAAAMPYIVSFLAALTQVAQIIVDLIPKYFINPRAIPLLGIDGKKSYKTINQNNSPRMNYSANSLNVKVEAGVNFSVSKNRALSQIIALSQASPMFAQFINSEGLPILLDNIEIRGIDQLKMMAEKWMEEQKQKQAQMAQQDPNIIKQKNESIKLQQNQQKMILDAKSDHNKLMIEQMKMEAQARQDRTELQISHEKTIRELELKVIEIMHNREISKHDRALALAELHHKINVESKKQNKEEKQENIQENENVEEPEGQK